MVILSVSAHCKTTNTQIRVIFILISFFLFVTNIRIPMPEDKKSRHITYSGDVSPVLGAPFAMF